MKEVGYMAILLLLLIFMYLVIKKINNIQVKKIVLQKTIIALVFQMLILILYRLELFSLDRIVYFSDAEQYWNHTISFLNGDIYYTYNELYVWISYLIQKTSPFIWVGWNNIYNILILDFSVIMCCYMISKNCDLNCGNEDKEEHEYIIKNISMFCSLTMLNPLVIYSLMRNLKDATFLFFICFSLFLYYFFLIEPSNKSKNIYIFSQIGIGILAYLIRPWAFVITLIAIYNYSINEKKIKRMLVVAPIIGIVSYFIFKDYFVRMFYSVRLWIPIVIDNGKVQGIKLPLSVARFFLGPGPVRALQGDKYFSFYTITGNIFSFIGNFLWWIQLSLMVSNIKIRELKGKKLDIFSRHFLLILLFYISIYSMVYSGSVELRFRGVLYVLVSALFFNLFKIKLRKDNLVLMFFYLGIISAIGIVASI